MTATTMQKGLNDTATILSNRLKVDMLEPIQMLDVDLSQFSTMLDHPDLKGDTLSSYIKDWLEDRLSPRTLSLGATAASADTTFTVGTGEGLYVKKDDVILICQTGERVRASADGASTSVSVVRGVGGVAAATAQTAALGGLVIIGHAASQGDTLPTMLITKQTHQYNYGQIQRKSWGFDRTARQSDWYSSNVLDSERDKKLSELKTDREDTLFFGARSYTADGGNGHPKGTAGGLIEFISTNKTDAGTNSGSLTTATLQNFLTTGLQFGSTQKVLFAAPKVGQAISSLLSSNWVRSNPDFHMYGAKVNAVISGAFGEEIPVIVKKQWGAYGTAASGNLIGNTAFLVDLASVRVATMQAPVRLSNRQANDLDGIEEEYLCEETLVVAQEQHHSLLLNVQFAGT